MDAIADEEVTFIARGHIKEWIPNPKCDYTEVYHVTCKRPIESLLEEGGWFCPMCRVKARERDTFFCLSAVLDDGSLPLTVELHWKVAEV
jgi:hypothetical protein